MNRIKLYYRVLKCFLTGNIVGTGDIAGSYSRLSSCYDAEFMNVMHKYNLSLLSMLKIPKGARILDLACGTGFNSEWLLRECPDGVDASEGMLEEAGKRLNGTVRLIRASMLEFLEQCGEETYDIIVCSWALMYQPPLKVLQQCGRVLKRGGQIGIIVNSKATLPEIRKVYRHILIHNPEKVKKLMLELPNPKNERQLRSWLRRSGLSDVKTSRGLHRFHFGSSRDAAEWVTSTGALAGFDVMVDLRDHCLKEQVSRLLSRFGTAYVTHDFVLGVACKC